MGGGECGVHVDNNNTQKCTSARTCAYAHTHTRQCFPMFLLKPHFNLRLTGPMPNYFPKNCKVARGAEFLDMTTGGKACWEAAHQTRAVKGPGRRGHGAAQVG